MATSRVSLICISACSVLGLLTGCGKAEREDSGAPRTHSKRLDLIRDAALIKPIADFEREFSITHHSLLYRGSNSATWNAKALLHDRYVLNLRVPVKEGDNGIMVQAPGELEIWVREIEKVTSTNIKYTPHQRKITEEDWSVLVQSGMDFSKIGYEMIVDQPVLNLRIAFPEA